MRIPGSFLPPTIQVLHNQINNKLKTLSSFKGRDFRWISDSSQESHKCKDISPLQVSTQFSDNPVEVFSNILRSDASKALDYFNILPFEDKNINVEVSKLLFEAGHQESWICKQISEQIKKNNSLRIPKTIQLISGYKEIASNVLFNKPNDLKKIISEFSFEKKQVLACFAIYCSLLDNEKKWDCITAVLSEISDSDLLETINNQITLYIKS
ncbi:MAG: hypothetical protein JHC93_03580 [Parachlamydiales bacterium]|nr:hypothetical protein [Parachlamydiales bacterium]